MNRRYLYRGFRWAALIGAALLGTLTGGCVLATGAAAGLSDQTGSSPTACAAPATSATDRACPPETH